VIEAMLTGLPVVASDIAGPREQVVPGVTGLLVPPRQVAPLADALARLAADPALRAAMGEAGRARAIELYNEARVVARTLDLLGLGVYPAHGEQIGCR
jgi:glycosyltransferase involved in cell wall biosynthesis